MLDFWVPFADWAGQRNIVIYLENLWEAGPEIQGDIITMANHPNLKASFDNGHALVFSDVPAKRSFEMLGRGLLHCHLHDNSGEIDEHEVVGDGKEDWPDLLSAVTRWAPDAILVSESDWLDKNRKSIERLKGF